MERKDCSRSQAVTFAKSGNIREIFGAHGDVIIANY